jgi:glycosyltransferase involved in cell wall biosynthesis
VVVVSRELAEALAPQGICPPDRLWVIENGVDLARFRPDADDRAAVRRELALPADAQVIGTVSRLVPGKDVPGLVRACAPLLNARLRLAVVGDGPARDAVVDAAAAVEGGAFVHLLGAREDVPRLLRAFDLFALFSRTEGHPVVVLEAMATGLPVVATGVGGIPGIVDADSGAVVPPGDEAALRAGIAALLDDPVRRAAAGRHARSVAAARYSVERMVDDYLGLYARVRTRGEEALAWSKSS